MNIKVIWLGLGALLLTLCTFSDAQQSQKIYKVGRLSAGSPADPLSKATYEVFQEGLRDLGWVEGRNIVLENRWVGDKTESAVNQAAELVRLNVDVIVAVGSPMIQAAKQSNDLDSHRDVGDRCRSRGSRLRRQFAPAGGKYNRT